MRAERGGMRLKKMWIIVAGAAVAAIVALAVFVYARNQGAPIQDNVGITSFCYSHSGSSTSEMYLYEIEADDESSGTVVNYEFNNGFETYTLPADGELMQQLSAVVDGHDLRKWNGFDKSNSLVMDGSGFYLRIDFSDGTQIMARGSNRYPAGYSEAVDAIDVLFLDYLKKNGIDPEEGF